MHIVGILLCGGSARRFGGDKLLAGDEPLVARAARNLKAVVPETLAVIALGRGALRRVLEGEGCDILETDRTSLGMGASLAAGVEATASAEGWIVALGDMPAIRSETLQSVKEAIESGAALAAPFDAQGRRGHPVGFSSSLREELLALEGDVGAREILARHGRSLRRIATDDEGIFVDIDTRDDLERYLRR